MMIARLGKRFGLRIGVLIRNWDTGNQFSCLSMSFDRTQSNEKFNDMR